MYINKANGEKGESLAADFLIKKGFSVVLRNYRYKRGEIDLIVRKDQLLVFVEVKARSSQSFGFPEEAVNEKKASMVIDAANQYILETDWQSDIRFDVIAITLKESPEILHLEDAFY